jgi:hypothetical protein
MVTHKKPKAKRTKPTDVMGEEQDSRDEGYVAQ